MKPMFFSRLAGDSPQILEQCSEKARINSTILGMTLLIPISLWFAGAFATAWMMGAPVAVCILSGASCGGIIGLLDRGMMGYLSRRGRSGAGLIARLCLAFAASLVFAHPAIFLLARGVIDREIDSAKEQTVAEYESALAPQLSKARERVGSDIAILDQRLADAEARLKLKSDELRASRAKTEQWLREADEEARGLRGSPPGEKSNYRRAMANVEESKKREASLAFELGALEKRVENARAEAVQARNGFTTDPEIVRLDNEWASFRSTIRSQNLTDPFSRFEALHRLIARNWKTGSNSLGIAYALLCFVLLGLELVPVLLKMASLKGEHALKGEGFRFKAEQDLENLIQVYPALSLDLIRMRLQSDAQKENVRLDHEVAVDYVTSHRRVMRSILAEKEAMFEMADQFCNRIPTMVRAEHREMAESVARQLVDGFLQAVTATLRQMRPPASRENFV